MRTRIGLFMIGAAAAALGGGTAAQAQAPAAAPARPAPPQATASAPAVAAPALKGTFPPVTADRLKNADSEPQNVLMQYGNWSNWHYSGLDQINRTNVRNLRVVYMASIGGCAMPQGSGIATTCNEMSQPLVDAGIMYLNDNAGRVMAYDVTSGDRAYPLWRYDPLVPATSTDRGIALWGNWVIQDTGGPVSGGDTNTRVIAVDRKTGEKVWEVGQQQAVGPNTAAMIASQNFDSVPQVVHTVGGKDLIIEGTTGSGIGNLVAFDANNGKLVWRTFTIPQPGEKDFGTWPGEAWKTGGAMPWGAPPSFDPDTNTLHKGTGEPSPVYDPEYRPGANLYSISMLALDADTGKIKWYFQQVPNDQWDYDSSASNILFDAPVDGRTRKVVGNWERNGFFYKVDRVSGQFLSGVAQLDNINWTKGLDPKTGQPIEYDPSKGLQTYNVAGPRRGRSASDAPAVCATWGGGTTGIWPGSYDPKTGYTYNTRTTGCTYQTLTKSTDEGPFNPLARENLGSAITQIQVDTKFALIAIDTKTDKVVKTFIRDQGIPNDRQAEVGALATAGGLVFTAGDDGRVSAFNSDTLEELWHFNAGTGMKGGIMSFAVDGKQYVAKIVGGDNPGSVGVAKLKLPTAMLVVWGL